MPEDYSRVFGKSPYKFEFKREVLERYFEYVSASLWVSRRLLGDVPLTIRAIRAADKKPDPSPRHFYLPHPDERQLLEVTAGSPGDVVADEYAFQHYISQELTDLFPAAMASKRPSHIEPQILESYRSISMQALPALANSLLKWRPDPFVVSEAMLTCEAVAERTYESQQADLIVSFTKSRRQKAAVYFNRGILNSKWTSTLFSGHRTAIICSKHAAVITIRDFPTRKVGMGSRFFVAPLEYQPALFHSTNRDAIQFHVTRRREILVSIGDRIAFCYRKGNWEVFPRMRFVSCLIDNISRLSKGRYEPQVVSSLACYLAMICLTLRHRGKGGLIVFCRGPIVAKEFIEDCTMPGNEYDSYYRSQIVGKKLNEIPVDLLCNTIAIDGATVISPDAIVRAFGAIANTDKKSGTSTGARTRAAEFSSKTGIAIKISQDGGISVYRDGKAKPILEILREPTDRFSEHYREALTGLQRPLAPR
ncbi:DNA integrity scanning protein DisA nucleotide-binding domain protein [bacterium AH-315-F18]|nr:DNA integrity scanning protein DisA nucleotide-binding domain protein [bacterium AH-315-F18]